MRKGSDIIGLSVITTDRGESLESIKDVIFDQHTNQVLGFLVDEAGWNSSARVLPFDRIQALGVDGVLVANRQAIVNAPQFPAIQAILGRENVLKGTTLMTTDGRELGTLRDLYFDEQSGVVDAYETSGGVFADMYTGQSYVPASKTFTIGTDVAFVPPEVVALMEEHREGGIKDKLSATGDSIRDAASSARSSVSDTLVDPAQQRQFVLGRTAEEAVTAADGTLIIAKGETVSPLHVERAEQHQALDTLYRATGGSMSAGVREMGADATATASVEAARGRRVQRPVRTATGIYVAAPGQIVGDREIERARQYDCEQELLAAVGLAPESAARNQAGDAASAVKEGAENVWDKVKSAFSTAKDETAEEIEERRIKHALGRPVTRVILSPADEIILNTGEIITHKAVELARSGNVLDILLSSVFDHEPPLNPAAARADGTGSAALDTSSDDDDVQQEAGA